MKLILTILVLASLNGSTQPLFKAGSYYAKNTQVRDIYGTVWQARTTINPAVSPPIAGAYWSYVRVGPSMLDSLKTSQVTTTTTNVVSNVRQSLLDSLVARIKVLESVTPAPTTSYTAIEARVRQLERPTSMPLWLSDDFDWKDGKLYAQSMYLWGGHFIYDQSCNCVKLRQ